MLSIIFIIVLFDHVKGVFYILGVHIDWLEIRFEFGCVISCTYKNEVVNDTKYLRSIWKYQKQIVKTGLVEDSLAEKYGPSCCSQENVYLVHTRDFFGNELNNINLEGSMFHKMYTKNNPSVL